MGVQLRNENVTLFGHYFKLPIHPLLFDPQQQFEQKTVVDTFGRAFKDWKKQFPALVAQMPPKEQERYAFTQDTPSRLTKTRTGYEVRGLGWWCRAAQDDNGLARELNLDMNCSCIGINRSSMGWDNELFLAPDGMYKTPFADAQTFSTKENEYRDQTGKLKAVMVACYSGHNIDHAATSLMLRLWGITYLNTLMDKLKL